MSTPVSRSWVAAALVAAAVVCPRAAAAQPVSSDTSDPYQLGVFFGPRIFSDNSSLGAKEDYRTTLETAVAFGVRFARPVLSWLVPEIEVPFAVTTTKDANDVTVAWFDPRILMRFVPLPEKKLRPFVVFGAGVPLTMSTKRGIFGSDISYDAFGGIGAQASPGRGLHFRVDVRVSVTDGVNEEETSPVAIEAEVMVGLWIDLGGGSAAKKKRGKGEIVEAVVEDQDDDGFDDDDDQCPDRAEDADGYEDRDGCPDIDNDLDRVLDIADSCATVPETFNGFDDEDGCPDTVPQDLDDALGTIEGLIYAEGSIDVVSAADKALDKAAELLTKYRGVRVLIIGHTDDREAELPEVPEGEEVDPEERAAQLAEALLELSRQRAAGVGAALQRRGISKGRIVVLGKGAEEPVSDNDTPRGRRSNRRVETKLYVPER